MAIYLNGKKTAPVVKVEVSKPTQSKTVNPTTYQQVVGPDEGYELSGVIVEGVTNEIDSNIKAENIAKDVTILGVTGTFESGVTPEGTLEITNDGTYDVTNFAIANVNTSEAVDRLQWKCDNLKHLYYEFNQYSGTSLDDILIGLDTSKVTNFPATFYQCKNLISIPDIDTSSAINTQYMFYLCSSLKKVPNLNLSNVLNTTNMFSWCSALEEVPSLDTSKVTNMAGMFSYSVAIKKIGDLDTSSVTDVSNMFAECRALIRVPVLDLNAATSLNGVFAYCNALENVEIKQLPLNITSTSSLSRFFYECSSLKKVIFREITYVPRYGQAMFSGCYHFYGTVNATYNPNGDRDGLIYVPDNLVEEFKVATSWSQFADQIKPLSELVE